MLLTYWAASHYFFKVGPSVKKVWEPMWQLVKHLNHSRLTIHLSLLIFQLLFKGTDFLLQMILFFQQGVSLSTEQLRVEGIIKPICTGNRTPEKRNTITNTPPQCDWTSQWLWWPVLPACWFAEAVSCSWLPPRLTGPEHQEHVPETKPIRKFKQIPIIYSKL